MKVTGFRATLVDVPFERSVAAAIHAMRSAGSVLLELQTDDGLAGKSHLFTLNGVRPQALHEMLLGFAHQVDGRNPNRVTAIGQAIWDEMNPVGHKGFPIAAPSAIDTACRDLVGKVPPLENMACTPRVRSMHCVCTALGRSGPSCSFDEHRAPASIRFPASN